ncbi:hypothetical protein BZA77DRAFT_358765 [Pyronema omphalodes]|nr:hypothetical protein BZA77DRAFT_358765 [Pyronema omphalodes]
MSTRIESNKREEAAKGSPVCRLTLPEEPGYEPSNGSTKLLLPAMALLHRASAIQNALAAPPIVNPFSHATTTSAIVLCASRPLESKELACGMILCLLGFIEIRKKPDEGERQAAKLKAAVEQHE